MITQEEHKPAHGSSFAKGLGVLSWIADHEGLRADEIADSLELPVSSVYRYLRALREQDFVAEEAGRYRAGRRMGGRGSGSGGDFVSMCEPFLRHLSAETGETAVLTVRHGLHAVCVRQVEARYEIRLAFSLGQLLPLYAGAGQRVLLAFAPDEVQRAVIGNEQHPITPETPTRAELTRQLRRIRTEGVAVSRGELIAGSFAMAMPVLHHGRAVAGVCLAGPRNRCGADWQVTARRELAAATASMAAIVTDE